MGRDEHGRRVNQFEELIIDFTVHRDVEYIGNNGLFLQFGSAFISDVQFYFGLQTATHPPRRRDLEGPGIIYSRWDSLDLANARPAEPDGWADSSSHEGDFIGVRKQYGWGAGNYRVRLALDGEPEDNGVWFGLWITDLSTGIETWIGSLKFPLLDDRAVIQAPVATVVEVYGRRTRPIDIPNWSVSIQRPEGDGRRPSGGYTVYSGLGEPILNSEIRYDPSDDMVHIEVGGTTKRRTPAGAVTFK